MSKQVISEFKVGIKMSFVTLYKFYDDNADKNRKPKPKSCAFVQLAIPGLQFFDESRDKDSITTQIVLFCVAGRDDIIF